MHTYKIGEIAYLVESNHFIMEGKILRRFGNEYLFRFIEGGGIRVRGDRLYPTEEAAQAYLDRRRKADREHILRAFG